jgi:curved DNA-binding protein
MNPYEILGIDESATQDEIKSAYRKLAGKLHPDRNPEPNAEDRLKEVNGAYELLKSPEKRAAFDRSTKTNNNRFDHNSVFTQFSDIFQRHNSTKSLNIPINLSIEEVFSGKRITTVINLDGEDIDLDFAIPAGVPEGARFNVKKIKSKSGFDVMINVTVNTINEHNRQRHVNDILMIIQISAFDAILGTDVEVEPIIGSKLKLKVPPCTQPDTKLIMRGAGLPIFNQSARGNVVGIIKVQIPKNLTSEQLDIIKSLR